MLPIQHINYSLDKDTILKIANDARKSSRLYHESMKNWQWAHNVKHPYFYKVMKDLKVFGWVDFYFQEPNSLLVPHIDPKSLCAINFVLSSDPAPVTFYENATSKDNLGTATHYTYSQAILNTTIFHSVQTDNTERLLFKICISNEDFDSVVKKLTINGNVA